jgi:hypothetical protein
MVQICVVPMDRFWAMLSTWLARRKRIGKTLALIAFAAGVAAGGGLYIVVDGLYVKLTTPPPGATMAAIGNYLALSASIRPTVQNAISNVQSCAGSLASAESALRQASTTRQAILRDLRTLSVSGLPNGAQLVGALSAAMQDSRNADNDYHAWIADLAASASACGSDPNQDPNYVAAASASSAATTYKDAFLAIWNPMAPHYEQQTYTVTGF